MTHGGDMTESQHATWILSHCRCSECACGMHLLINDSCTGAEQYTDIIDSRLAKDFEDMKQ